jgi:WD40 repeat protein/energy-coupling factor transporter ATP-binding protein EcfA2
MPRPEKPLDPFAGPVEKFAFDLRKLREKAGSPGYRELGRISHYSASTLADAARGQRLPSLAVALAFVRACGGDEETWERRWRDIGEHDAEASPADSPYVGLKAFTEQDAGRFFGRERLVGKLLGKLEHHDTVLVIGASGSGKSSLLRAGLLARTEGELITPSTHHTLPQTEEPLVVDQFEEIFSLPHRDEFISALTAREHKTVIGLRADFYGHCARYPGLVSAIEDAQVLVGPMTTDELRKAITQPAVEVGCALETGLVARLIADATGEPGVLPHVSHALLETWQRKRGNTLTLTSYHESGGIARAIANTAEHAFTGLDEQQQVRARQVFLRLITPGEGTEDTKRRVKRTELAADDVVEHLAAARILTVDDDSVEISHEAVIRGWPRLRDWLAEARDDLRVHRRLTAAAADWEAHGRDPGSLHRGVPLEQATDWAQREPGALNAQEQAFLDASTGAGIRAHAVERRRTTNLRRVVALLAALLLVATTATVFAVRAQRQATEQQTSALAQKAIAEANVLQDHDPALASQLRLAAYRLTGAPAARDALLSTFAGPQVTLLKGHTDATSYAVFRPDGKVMATVGDDKALIFWDLTDPHHPAELSRVNAGDDATHHMTFSSDGNLLVTANWDGLIRLVDVSDPRNPIEKGRVSGHDGQVQSVVLTEDARTLVSSGKDRTIRVWRIADNRAGATLVRTIEGHTNLVHGVALTSSDTVIGSSSWDGTVKLWDLATGAPLSTVDPSNGDFAVDSVAFSPDGTTMATGADSGELRLWNIRDPRNPAVISSSTEHVFSVHTLAFSPDGRFLASGGGDKNTRLWDLRDQKNFRVAAAFTGHTDTLWSLEFSADSRYLVSTSTDTAIRMIDLDSLAVPDHSWTVWDLAYDGRGRFFATISSDGTIKLWRPDGRHPREVGAVPLDSGGEATAVAMHPERDVLFSSNSAGSALWDTTDPATPRRITDVVTGTEWIGSATFSHDGKTLAVSENTGAIQLWDVSDLASPKRLGQFSVPAVKNVVVVQQMRFTEDDRTLAIAGGLRELELWDVRNPAQPRAYPGIHTEDTERPIQRGGQAGRNVVMSVAVHGNVLAFANMDSTATLWDVSDPAQPRKLGTVPHDGPPLQRVSFSPDGTLLASGTTDDLVRVWDVRDPAHPTERAVLHGHTDRLWGVAFAPDGHTIATTGTDRTIRVWDIDVEATASQVCATTTAHLSTRQWEQYFPGVEPRPLC